MNTPSPALLRKALKIVNEIEKLDQEIHRLLVQVQQTTVAKNQLALTRIFPASQSEALPKPMDTVSGSTSDQSSVHACPPDQNPSLHCESHEISELTRLTEEVLSHLSESLPLPKEKEKAKQVVKESTSMIPVPPHHEQQSLLMDDVDVALQPSVRDEEPSMQHEQHDEQSCCLF